MSARAAHEQGARTNAALAQGFRRTGGDSLVWVPTLFFYAAVQLVEAALADYAEHPFGHPDRKVAIASRWPPAGSPFENLKQLSEDWRYKARRPIADDIGRAHRWCEDVAVAVGETWFEVPKA